MTTTTPDFDLHRTSNWLADTTLTELDQLRTDLVSVVDAAARAAGAPEALRPAPSDPTPALVRLFNRHACEIKRRQRLAA